MHLFFFYKIPHRSLLFTKFIFSKKNLTTQNFAKYERKLLQNFAFFRGSFLFLETLLTPDLFKSPCNFYLILFANSLTRTSSISYLEFFSKKFNFPTWKLIKENSKINWCFASLYFVKIFCTVQILKLIYLCWKNLSSSVVSSYYCTSLGTQRCPGYSKLFQPFTRTWS